MVQVLTKTRMKDAPAEMLAQSARPRWSSRTVTLPFLSDISLQPTSKKDLQLASLCVNDQLELHDIEVQGVAAQPKEIKALLPWVLVDDEHHIAPVLTFRSSQCAAHLLASVVAPLQETAFKPEAVIAHWNLLVTDIRITPVEQYWHDTVAIIRVSLNNEMELNGIRLLQNNQLHWPLAIRFTDTSLQNMIEAAIMAQLSHH